MKARLCFYYLCLILHHTADEPDSDEVRDFEEKLKELRPELYNRYRENRKNVK